MSRVILTAEFCDDLVRRLKAGADPEALRLKLRIGTAAMARYVAIAKVREAA